HVTHNHSSAYSSTLAVGVWVFEDAFDARFFENQARKIAAAIELAAADLRPARMGAATVRHHIYKGNIVGLKTADNGTPAGYPDEYGDHGLPVLRFDDVQTGEPIAVWVNWGEHPESLDGFDLHSADFLAALERFVDREIGAPLIFSQGDVGSAEKSGNPDQRLRDDGSICNDEPGEVCPQGEGVWRDWNHQGYVQTERNVRYLADAIIKGWQVIGGELPTDDEVPAVEIPFTTDFPVAIKTAWVPGPLSHPYPSVSNCNTDTTVEGDIGVPVAGLPDCAREGFPGDNPLNEQLALIYHTLKAEGVPVPDHYDAPSFSAVEENLRLQLQAVRIGDILLASCACEAQNDLILNLESRTDATEDNIYDGFDWACVAEDLGLLTPDPDYAEACTLQREQYYDVAEFPTAVPGSLGDPDLIAHMRAQIHNDARGWDAPENALTANTEASDIASIKGNFTKEEIQDLGTPGYKMTIGVGHAGDYNGYTVSYREYMNRDHYRKALTAYGPHTADYMVTRLVRMAAELQGGPALAPEPHDPLAQIDEVRQEVTAQSLGQVSSRLYDIWQAVVPLDVGPANALEQPSDITHFNAATFRWRGGNTQVDNPRVIVQRMVGDNWQDFADQSGEVQTRVFWPAGIQGSVTAYAGQFTWEWLANFEAYRAFPARLGDTPIGDYRFVVSGCINDGQENPESNLTGRLERLVNAVFPAELTSQLPLEANGCAGGSRPYELVSDVFSVSEFAGDVPKSYSSVFPYVETDDREDFCENCSFRPWAR
ncbi:MAG: hypothetical protein R3352_08460, partial [Salinisphaeraceae bacterium]|nr:hypothetical protein [Salinisphaeraceae bacterium]